MIYLFDTDVVIDLLKNYLPTVQTVTPLIAAGAAISILTYSELWEGTLRGPDAKAQQRSLRTFLQGVQVLGVNRAVARRNAELRADLRARKLPVQQRAFDLLLDATALHYGLTLVTRNQRDYADIVGLSLYPL